MRIDRRSRRKRVASLGIESLEGRAVLSTVTLSPASNILSAQAPAPAPPPPPTPSDTPVTSVSPVTPAPVVSNSAAGINPNLNQNLKSITHSSVYRNLGNSYVRQVFSGDTYAVTNAYKHAIYTVNFKEIRRINRSRYLKIVGDQFTQPVHSTGFKSFSRHLDLFGRAVEHRYHKVVNALSTK